MRISSGIGLGVTKGIKESVSALGRLISGMKMELEWFFLLFSDKFWMFSVYMLIEIVLQDIKHQQKDWVVGLKLFEYYKYKGCASIEKVELCKYITFCTQPK